MIRTDESPIPADWHPTVSATLLFVRDDRRVLLIEKKRGFGAGKINGPGGKVEPGEAALDAAVRETREEIGITVHDPEEVARLCFRFADGLNLECRVFLGTKFEGELVETDEAKPFWCVVSEIPFERMWADDVYWLPRVLEGERLDAFFEFEGEVLLSGSYCPQHGSFPEIQKANSLTN